MGNKTLTPDQKLQLVTVIKTVISLGVTALLAWLGLS